MKGKFTVEKAMGFLSCDNNFPCVYFCIYEEIFDAVRQINFSVRSVHSKLEVDTCEENSLNDSTIVSLSLIDTQETT